MPDKSISIEVAFGTAKHQELVSIEVSSGTTIAEAVTASGLPELFPDEKIESMTKGIWSQVKPDSYLVCEGDRIEIYRPLVTDAKGARRKRARKSE